jgi:DNA-binding XRE family transcriptional regulator
MTDSALVRSVRVRYGLFRRELAMLLGVVPETLDLIEAGQVPLLEQDRAALATMERRRSLCPACRTTFPAAEHGYLHRFCPRCVGEDGRPVPLSLRYCVYCYRSRPPRRDTCRHCGELAPQPSQGGRRCRSSRSTTG